MAIASLFTDDVLNLWLPGCHLQLVHGAQGGCVLHCSHRYPAAIGPALLHVPMPIDALTSMCIRYLVVGCYVGVGNTGCLLYCWWIVGSLVLVTLVGGLLVISLNGFLLNDVCVIGFIDDAWLFFTFWSHW